jgi:hypothetical protein
MPAQAADLARGKLVALLVEGDDALWLGRIGCPRPATSEPAAELFPGDKMPSLFVSAESVRRAHALAADGTPRLEVRVEGTAYSIRAT